MDYNKAYHNIIENAKNRTLTGYYEEHHIIPQCIGGDNEKNNLVKLTAREHFIVHVLLHKMLPENNLLLLTVVMMTGYQNKKTSKDYAWLKEKWSGIMKNEFNPAKRGLIRKGKNHPHYGKSMKNWISKDGIDRLSNRMKINNPNKGKKAWEHPRSTKECKMIWWNANEYYKYWVQTKCSAHKMAKAFGYSSPKGSHLNMYKKFNDMWIPLNDEHWKTFYDSCKI